MKCNYTPSCPVSVSSLIQISFFLLLYFLIFATPAMASTDFKGKCSDIFTENSTEIKNSSPLDNMIQAINKEQEPTLMTIALIAQVDTSSGGSLELGNERLEVLKKYFQERISTTLKVEGYANTIPIPTGTPEESAALFPDKLTLHYAKSQPPLPREMTEPSKEMQAPEK